MTEEYFDETDEDLSEYPTRVILHDYKMLIEDFGPDDDLVAEMRGILVSRHRYLTGDEADVAPCWQHARRDMARSPVSPSLIFEVDEEMFNFYACISSVLRQRVPTRRDRYKCLIGLQVQWEDALFSHVDAEAALKIIDTILRAVPNGVA